MRIFFLNSVSGGGGGASSTEVLARGLAAAGHEVTVACSARGELRRRIADGERLRIVPFRSGPDLDPIAARRIARLVRAAAADVALADRRRDVKSLILARAFGATLPVVHRHGAPSGLRSGPSYRFFWRRVAAVIVNSEAMRRRLCAEAPFLRADALHVIHNGVDGRTFRPLPDERAGARTELGLVPDDFVVAYHGVLQSRKRVALLLRAAARVEARRALRLLIIGDGPERVPLQSLAAALRVSAIFTGVREDLPRLLSAADVSAHLSTAEGFSNSVLEALACGLPVVATAEHSHPEQVEDGRTGLLVAPDPDAVARAIARLLADPATLGRLGDAARSDAVRRFSVHDMVDAYTAVLERAAGMTVREAGG